MWFSTGATLFWRSSWWWSAWALGACTTAVTRTVGAIVPSTRPRLRTPLLREHVQALKLNPSATWPRQKPTPQRALIS